MNGTTRQQYIEFKKPKWAPPGKVFAPVWTVLYICIGVTYGDVLYMYLQQQISFYILLPFVLNLIFNLAYTPLQFGMRSFKLATADIFLVLITLIWEMIAVFTAVSWITYALIPYLCWVCFAIMLQLRINRLNDV